VSGRRIWAIVRKELREYRRNRNIVLGMAVLPAVFAIQPLLAVLGLSRGAATVLAHEHVLLYMLGIPALVPSLVASSAIAGERQQGTLEPALTTPIRSEELLLGKALAALLPSLAIAYGVFALFLGVVLLFAQPGISSALFQGPDLLAQLVFTPLLATWTIWLGISVSTRSSDIRAAQQLGTLASLPGVFASVAVALNVVPPSIELALGAAALLVVLDVAGWRVASRLFDRERLIVGPR
jgi:ABC-type Na+ efflux pump permease subunit